MKQKIQLSIYQGVHDAGFDRVIKDVHDIGLQAGIFALHLANGEYESYPREAEKTLRALGLSFSYVTHKSGGDFENHYTVTGEKEDWEKLKLAIPRILESFDI